MEKTILAAGCFWGVEDLFKKLDGVLNTTVGYTAGHTPKPTYRDICTGQTGHAEAVLIEFDPKVVDFEKVLNHFFRLHDPTTLNRQGADTGSQYRSAIYYFTDEQKETATKLIDELDQKKIFENKIVTEVQPASTFFDAEEYHQDYFAKNSGEGCHWLRSEF